MQWHFTTHSFLISPQTRPAKRSRTKMSMLKRGNNTALKVKKTQRTAINLTEIRFYLLIGTLYNYANLRRRRRNPIEWFRRWHRLRCWLDWLVDEIGLQTRRRMRSREESGGGGRCGGGFYGGDGGRYGAEKQIWWWRRRRRLRNRHPRNCSTTASSRLVFQGGFVFVCFVFQSHKRFPFRGKIGGKERPK